LDGYQLLFSLKSTDFYVLNIHLDADLNTVKGLAIDKVSLLNPRNFLLATIPCRHEHGVLLVCVCVRASVTSSGLRCCSQVQSIIDCGVGSATTMTRLGMDYLFVGARIGDSALLQIFKAPCSDMTDKDAGNWLLGSVPGAVGEAGAVKKESVEVPSSAKGDDAMEEAAVGAGEVAPMADIKLEQGAAVGGKDASGAVKAEADSSDDELYGAPASATSPATTTMDVSGEDSDEELYATTATSGGGAAVGTVTDALGPRGGGDVDDGDMDDEDAAIYAVARAQDVGDAVVEKSELMVYALKQCDMMVGLGPVGDFALCPHRPKLDEVRKDSIDVVTASGGMGQSKLCVSHRSLNPVVTTAVSLPNAHAVWTVYGHEGDDLDAPDITERATDGEGKQGAEAERMHAYMIISEGGDEPGTVVLKGNELEEFDEDETMEFHTAGATVCVGNIFRNRRIVQVTPWNVLLLKGAVKEQEVPFVAGAGGQIVAAWVHDPYIAMLLQDGRLNLLVGDESTMQVNYLNLGGGAEISNITAACFLANPLLRCEASDPSSEGGEAGVAAAQGDKDANVNTHTGGHQDRGDSDEAELVEVMLAVAPRSGHLEVYSLPGLQLVYRASDLVLGPQLLMDEAVAPSEAQLDEVHEPPFIMDMRVEPIPDLGERAQDPTLLCLVAITSHADLLVYKSFHFRAEAKDASKDPAAAAGVLGLGNGAGAGVGSKAVTEGVDETRAGMQTVRFRRQHHEIMLRGEALWEDFFADEMELGDPTREATLTVLRTARLMPLDNASGVQGILVAARQPAVVVFSRGFVRVHPWKLDRNEGVRSSARFRSAAAGGDGIVCIGDKGRDKPRSMLKICKLPRDVVADLHWPVRTKHIGCTVHHLAYHPPSGCHVIISSVKDEMDEDRKPEGSLEGKVPTLVEERYQLQVCVGCFA
jgi:hypothetical protein